MSNFIKLFCLFFLFPLLGLKADARLDRLAEYDQQTCAEVLQAADTSTRVNSMKSICVRVSLKKGSTEAVKEWFLTLMDRREENLASLKNEGVVVESAFLDQQPDGDFLIYYMRAEDIERAIAVFQNSSLDIDAYHKDCWGKYCEASTPLEQLLDLDTIQMKN